MSWIRKWFKKDAEQQPNPKVKIREDLRRAAQRITAFNIKCAEELNK